MNRLIGVVDIINTFLDTHYFDDIKFYNVCQLVDMGSGEIPALYKGNGDMEAVVFDDTNGLNVYHRLISQSDVEDDNEGFGRNNLKSELYTMRAVFFGADQADILDESVDINYNIADEFKTLFPNRLTKNQLTNIDGLSGIVKTLSVNHNKQAVFNEEITNTSFTVTPESILFAIEYTISLQYLESCKTLICDPYPTTPMTDLSDISCENFLDDNFGLTQQQFDDCGLIIFAPTLAAAFSADDTTPTTGQTVTFTDTSTGSPTAWFWDFGDGEYSTSRNPTHTYYTSGNKTVTLTVTNATSLSDEEEKTNYIIVGFDTDAIDFHTDAGITGTLQKETLNTLVINLKGTGQTPNGNNLWAKIHALWPYCPVDETTANATAFSKDLKAAFNLTFSNFVAGDFGVNGLTGNGTTKFASTGLIPNSVVALNNASMGSYSRSHSSATANMGARNSDNLTGFSFFDTTANFIGDLNSATDMTVTSMKATGLAHYQRSASNLSTFLKEDVFIGSFSTASTTGVTVQVYLHGINNNGTLAFPSAKQFAGFYIAESFNASEYEDFVYCWQQYQETIIIGGRHINPISQS